jgi:hypothetical protein
VLTAVVCTVAVTVLAIGILAAVEGLLLEGAFAACLVGALILIMSSILSLFAVAVPIVEGLSFRANDNEVVKERLCSTGGLVQQIINEGNLTPTDFHNIIRAYDEVRKVSFGPRRWVQPVAIANRLLEATGSGRSVSAFDPNSPAMAEILHYLFLYGSDDIINNAIPLINDVAPKLNGEASKRIFTECVPHVKDNEQLFRFLSAFLGCRPPRHTDILDVLFGKSHPGEVLICKLVKTGAVADLQDFQKLLNDNPDIMKRLLKGDFKELNLNAIKLYVAIIKNQSAALDVLLEKLESDKFDRKMILKVMCMKDLSGNLLTQTLFSIVPTGMEFMRKFLGKLSIDDISQLKEDLKDLFVGPLLLEYGKVAAPKIDPVPQ